MKKKIIIFSVCIMLTIFGVITIAHSDDPTHWGRCDPSESLCTATCPSCGFAFFPGDDRLGDGVITRCNCCGYHE